MLRELHRALRMTRAQSDDYRRRLDSEIARMNLRGTPQKEKRTMYTQARTRSLSRADLTWAHNHNVTPQELSSAWDQVETHMIDFCSKQRASPAKMARRVALRQSRRARRVV